MKIFQLDDKEEEIEKLRAALIEKLGESIEAYVTAADYVTGIAAVKSQNFDIYILDGEFPYDMNSPVMVGDEIDTPFYVKRFIRELRQLKGSPNIVVYSGYARAPDGKNRKSIKEFDPATPFYAKTEMEELVESLSRK